MIEPKSRDSEQVMLPSIGSRHDYGWLSRSIEFVAETPRATKPHFQMLLRIGLSDEFPHMLIRAYAIDACQKLLKQGCVKLDSADSRQAH